MRRFLNRFRWRPVLPRQETFRYEYLRYPFDDPQYFSIVATAQSVADRLAKEQFTELFKTGQTVMIEFSRA